MLKERTDPTPLLCSVAAASFDLDMPRRPPPSADQVVALVFRMDIGNLPASIEEILSTEAHRRSLNLLILRWVAESSARGQAGVFALGSHTTLLRESSAGRGEKPSSVGRGNLVKGMDWTR